MVYGSIKDLCICGRSGPAPSESTDHANQTNDITGTVGIRMSDKRERDLFDSHQGASAYITRLIAG